MAEWVRVPDETARAARAALSPNHPSLRLADELVDLFADEGFADLFPAHGQPTIAPWRLALATILQFAEGLSDRQVVHYCRRLCAIAADRRAVTGDD